MGLGKPGRLRDYEVHPGQLISNPALPPIAGLGLEPIDEIDHVVEPPAGTAADATSGDSDGKMGLAGASSADQLRNPTEVGH